MVKWVNNSIKDLLVDNCQEYLQSKDLGRNKARTQLIKDVEDKIREAAPGHNFPPNLNKSIRNWFLNEAKRIVGETGQQSEGRGRKNKPGKVWNKRLVAAELYKKRLATIYQNVMQEYTGNGIASLRTYATAVTKLMEELSDEELEECQEIAETWNKESPPKDIQQKATKRLPALAKKFMDTVQREMGVTVFMLVQYQNEDGLGSLSKFESRDSTFTSEKPNWRNGPGNILDMWKDWAEDFTTDDDDEGGEDEEAPEDKVVLEYREDKYPILPTFDSNTGLDQLKRILRSYVRAVRHFQKMNGRIPWAAIRTDNDAYLSMKGKFAYTLDDPSRMSRKAVLAFLTHWQQRQEATKPWPLRFLTPSRQQFVEDTEILDHDIVEMEDEGHGEEEEQDGSGGHKGKEQRRLTEHQNGQGKAKQKHSPPPTGTHSDGEMVLPLTPGKVKLSLQKYFLSSLSSDKVFQALLRLLDMAEIEEDTSSVGRPGPNWGHWRYDDQFLPAAFHKMSGAGSCSHVLSWLGANPLANFEGRPAGYHRVSRTLLVLGLTLRELGKVLFSDEDDTREYPGYLQNSGLTLADWEKVIAASETLMRYVGIEFEPVPDSPERAEVNEEGSGSKLKHVGEDHEPNGSTKKVVRAAIKGIPPIFTSIREQLGLLHPAWDSLGEIWHLFIRKWLSAEAVLAKTERPVLSSDDLEQFDLPAPLKAWGVAHVNKEEFNDAIVTGNFGQEMRKWWDGLQLTQVERADHMLKLPWCRSGMVGIVMLIISMRWWAEKSGAGKEWERVVKEMTRMWEVLTVTSPPRSMRSQAKADTMTVPSLSRGKKRARGEQVPRGTAKRSRK